MKKDDYPKDAREYFIRQTLDTAITDLKQLAHDVEADMDYFLRIRQYADRMHQAITNNNAKDAKFWAEKYKEARYSSHRM